VSFCVSANDLDSLGLSRPGRATLGRATSTHVPAFQLLDPPADLLHALARRLHLRLRPLHLRLQLLLLLFLLIALFLFFLWRF